MPTLKRSVSARWLGDPPLPLPGPGPGPHVVGHVFTALGLEEDVDTGDLGWRSGLGSGHVVVVEDQPAVGGTQERAGQKLWSAGSRDSLDQPVPPVHFLEIVRDRVEGADGRAHHDAVEETGRAIEVESDVGDGRAGRIAPETVGGLAQHLRLLFQAVHGGQEAPPLALYVVGQHAVACGELSGDNVDAKPIIFLGTDDPGGVDRPYGYVVGTERYPYHRQWGSSPRR